MTKSLTDVLATCDSLSDILDDRKRAVIKQLYERVERCRQERVERIRSFLKDDENIELDPSRTAKDAAACRDSTQLLNSLEIDFTVHSIYDAKAILEHLLRDRSQS